MAVSVVSNTQYTPGATFTGGSYTTPGLPAATTGDIYFATVSWTAISGTGPSISFPAGWTQLQDSPATSRRGFATGYIAYTAGLSNPTFTSTRTDAGIAEVIITVIRGADLTSPIVGSSSVLTSSSSTSGSTIGGANAFTMSVAGSMVLWCAGWWNSNNTSTATWTGPTKSGQWISSVATSSGQYSYSSIATEFPASLTTGNATVGIGAAMGEPAVQGYAFRQAGSIEPPITQVGTTTSASSPDSVTTSLTCNLPSGLATGDVLIASYTISTDADTGAQVAITTPTGWTLFDSSTGGAKTRSYVYAKFWNGSETNVVFSHASVDCGDLAFVTAYRGADPSTPINQTSRYDVSSTAAVAIPAITTTGPNTIVHIVTGEYMNATITHTYSTGVKLAELCIDGGGIGTAEEVAGSVGNLPMSAAGSTGTITVTPSAAGTAGMRYGYAMVVQPLQNATKVDGDTGSAADNAVVRAFAPGADTAAAADAAVGVRVSGAADTSSAVDTASVLATTPPAVDTATAADTAAVRAYTGTVGDTGTFTESAYVSTALAGSDSALGTDAAVKVAISVAETAAAVDTAAVVAQVPAADTVTGLDNAKVVIKGAADTGSGSDAAKLAVKGTDASNPTTETASITVTVFASDTAVGTDSQIVKISGAADTGTAVDIAQRQVSGILIAPRVIRVAPEQRTYRIPAENRTIAVSREIRVMRVGYESDVMSISMAKPVTQELPDFNFEIGPPDSLTIG